jgi:hypothetical protein
MRKADVIHRATSRHESGTLWYIGLQVDMIGYFKSQCSTSGCKVEQDEQVRSAKDWLGDANPWTLEAIIQTYKVPDFDKKQGSRLQASYQGRQNRFYSATQIRQTTGVSWSGKKRFDFFAGFLDNHISRLDLGSGGSSNNRSTSGSLKCWFRGRVRQVALAHSQMEKEKQGWILTEYSCYWRNHLKGTRVLEDLWSGIKEKLGVGLDNSRRKTDAMPSDFRRLDFQTLDYWNKWVHLQETITKEEADLPALYIMADDPTNYHQ